MVKCNHLGRRRIVSPLSGEHPPSAAQGTPQPPRAHEAQHGVCKKAVYKIEVGNWQHLNIFSLTSFASHLLFKYYLLAWYH